MYLFWKRVHGFDSSSPSELPRTTLIGVCLELGWKFGQTTHSSDRVQRGVSLQLLHLDVEDAEGLDSEPAGEDRTCGKRTIRNVQQRHQKKRWKWIQKR